MPLDLGSCQAQGPQLAQDLTGDLGGREPVSRWLDGMNLRVASPDFAYVVHTQVGIHEQVAGLPVDLGRPVAIELIDIELTYTVVVLRPLTDDYSRVR